MVVDLPVPRSPVIMFDMNKRKMYDTGDTSVVLPKAASMTLDVDRTDTVPIQLEDGTIFKIEVVPQGREDVSFGTKSFEELAKSIEGVLKAIAEPVKKARPTAVSG